MARHLGGEARPSAAMLQELLGIFLAFGIAMSPSTSLLFRTLATLEGTLSTLCPGYPLVQAAEDFASELVGQRLAPATWEQTAKQELVTPSRQQSVRGPSRTAKSRSSRAPGTS
jgi:ubiquinone biosynthesis protein